MRVLYKDMRHAENNKYYVSLMVFYNKKGNNNVGYESKLYVVEKCNISFVEGMRGALVVAMFDLCKMGTTAFNEVVNTYPKTDCYFYADDGNATVVEDKYGEPLTEIPIVDMIHILKECKKEFPKYRRIDPAIKLLESFDLTEWKELVVLHYGH